MKRILQTTLLGAALLTAGVQAAGDPSANVRLLRAAARGDLAGVLKELPPTGNADVNARLILAAEDGHGYLIEATPLDMVNPLIGADVTVQFRGETALMLARKNKHADIVNALKAAGAK